MKTNGQLLWARRQVTIPANQSSVTVAHGLSLRGQPLPMAAELNAKVLAIPTTFGNGVPASLAGWLQLQQVTNNQDGTFTFVGPPNSLVDITFNVIFWLPHSVHGAENVPGAPEGAAGGQLLVNTLEIGTGPSSVPLSSIFVGARSQPQAGISGPSEIERVQVIPIMDGSHTLAAWAGCTNDIDKATDSITFDNVGQGPILALILLPHTMIGPVNADGWSGGARVSSAGSPNPIVPGAFAPNGQLLMSRERIFVPANIAVDVVTLKHPNEPYDPQGKPTITESIHVIPLAPLDNWLTGTIGNGNCHDADHKITVTNLSVEDPVTFNVLFWLIHSVLGPGEENPALYELPPT